MNSSIQPINSPTGFAPLILENLQLGISAAVSRPVTFHQRLSQAIHKIVPHAESFQSRNGRSVFAFKRLRSVCAYAFSPIHPATIIPFFLNFNQRIS